MELILVRLANSPNSTLGALYINGKFECRTLEDEYRKEKVWGRTRIPAGRYKISLRQDGSYYERYCKKFNENHPILWVQDVPNFEWIYIHIGNYHTDTNGCILVGEQYATDQEGDYIVTRSTSAYLKLYNRVFNNVLRDNVFISILDLDRLGVHNDFLREMW